MEKGLFVKDIRPGQVVKGFFLVQKASAKIAKSGQTYWSLQLSDATGSIEAKVWKPDFCGLSSLPEDSQVIEILVAKADIYKDVPQIIVEKLKGIDSSAYESLDPNWFLTKAPFDIEEFFGNFVEKVSQEFRQSVWMPLVKKLWEDPSLAKDFKTCPGAKIVHHAYLGGLIWHSYSVFELCRSFCSRYPWLDRPTLLCGALFHDIGKIKEYSFKLDFSSTDAGKLLGHMVLGVSLLEPYFKACQIPEPLAQHLRHMILSHHGVLDYGACVLPQTEEALALHFADNLDSKMDIAHKALEDIDSNAWSAKIFPLEQRSLYKVSKSSNFKIDGSNSETEIVRSINNLEDLSNSSNNQVIEANFFKPNLKSRNKSQSASSMAKTKSQPQAKKNGEGDCLSLLKV